MKNSSIFLGTLLSFFIAFSLVSCGGNCQNVECVNGLCDEAFGTCRCSTGYELDADGKCTILSRDKFISSSGWKVVDICPSGTYNYDAVISPTISALNKVIVNHYGGYEAGSSQLAANAVVEGVNINIESDSTTLGGDNFIIHATTGTLIGDTTFNLNYKITTNGVEETCAATFKKK